MEDDQPAAPALAVQETDTEKASASVPDECVNKGAPGSNADEQARASQEPAPPAEPATATQPEAPSTNPESAPAAPEAKAEEAHPSLDEVYARIMSKKLETEITSNGSTPTQRSLQGLGSGGGPGSAAAPGAPASAATNTAGAALTLQPMRTSAVERLMTAAGGGDSNAQQMLRSTTMENILAGMRTVSGLSNLDEGLLNWGSLPQDRFLEGLASDMKEIETLPPDARAMRRTFTIERILSGGQGDLAALAKEAQATGPAGIRLEGGGGVVSALAAAQQQGDGTGAGSALVKRAAMGLVDLEPGPKRTRSGLTLDLAAAAATPGELTARLTSDTEREAERLESENAALQGLLDTLLLQVDAVQQDNVRIKGILLEGCAAQGLTIDMNQLNANIATHRPPPPPDGASIPIAANALVGAGGNVAIAVQNLMAAALQQGGGGLGMLDGMHGHSAGTSSGAPPGTGYGMGQLQAGGGLSPRHTGNLPSRLSGAAGHASLNQFAHSLGHQQGQGALSLGGPSQQLSLGGAGGQQLSLGAGKPLNLASVGHSQQLSLGGGQQLSLGNGQQLSLGGGGLGSSQPLNLAQHQHQGHQMGGGVTLSLGNGMNGLQQMLGQGGGNQLLGGGNQLGQLNLGSSQPQHLTLANFSSAQGLQLGALSGLAGQGQQLGRGGYM